jgi:hypothetical protein
MLWDAPHRFPNVREIQPLVARVTESRCMVSSVGLTLPSQGTGGDGSILQF